MVKDVKVKRGPEINSDLYTVKVKIQIMENKRRDKARRKIKKY